LSQCLFKESKLLKYIVASEIDNLARFRNARALVAYAGLIPRERSSGEKIRKGALRLTAYLSSLGTD